MNCRNIAMFSLDPLMMHLGLTEIQVQPFWLKVHTCRINHHRLPQPIIYTNNISLLLVMCVTQITELRILLQNSESKQVLSIGFQRIQVPSMKSCYQKYSNANKLLEFHFRTSRFDKLFSTNGLFCLWDAVVKSCQH